MPRFETDEDRNRQTAAAKKIEEAWGFVVSQKNTAYGPIDWLLVKNDRPVAVAEYKWRNQKYQTVFLSKRKYDVLMKTHKETNLCPLFFWEFKDGIYWIDVRDVDASITRIAGRTDRPDAANDQEEMIDVPTNLLLPLTGNSGGSVYDHPALYPILGKTQGIMVYQEQIMRIGREIGGLSWEEVTGLRRAMGKSMGADYLNRWGEPFKAGARQRTNMTDEQLDQLWSDMCGFGSYAFNRSHAVAYGIVSYWCCWLKAHYPIEFAAATLDSLAGDQTQQIVALREMRDEGVDYVPVDVERSTDKWSVTESDGHKLLVGPLSNIKGVGPEKVRAIIEARQQHDSKALNRLLKSTKTQIDTLTPVRDRVASLHPSLPAIKIVTPPTDIEEIKSGARDFEVVIIGKVTKVMTVDANDAKSVERRGYRLKGPSDVLKFRIADDTDEIMCRIGNKEFATMGREVAEQANIGKSLFAVKGRVPKGFRMVMVNKVKYLGEMEDGKA